MSVRGRLAPLSAVLAVVGLATACSTVGGSGQPATEAQAGSASIQVVGDSGSKFDTAVKNSMADVLKFWSSAYPTVADGKSLPPLQGKLYSVDGSDPSDEAKGNGCLAKKPSAVENNAFFCRLDDSIAWDRDPQHLVPVLGAKYGDILTAMVFAHEFGHAIQYRLGIFDKELPTIATESQADCASGAFMAWVAGGYAQYTKASPAQLDEALNGYLQVRDAVPDSAEDVSHGNGFDRLGAVQYGIQNGPKACYAEDYFNRKYTERPYTNDTDYDNNGNLPLAQILSDSGGGLFDSLNQYWAAKAKSIQKTWKDVSVKQADHPKCGSPPDSEFGYCPDDNTVYYSNSVAEAAYNSISAISGDKSTGNIRIVDGQPGDYALGTLFVYGWGLAVRHQLFDRSLDDRAALLAASCYTGAYSSSINIASTEGFALSPADMDEATSAILNVVPQDRVFGEQDTTALQRIQSFITGYFGTLTKC